MYCPIEFCAMVEMKSSVSALSIRVATRHMALLST